MTKEFILATKENRLSTILARGKKSRGVVRRLEREIRNLKASM